MSPTCKKIVHFTFSFSFHVFWVSALSTLLGQFLEIIQVLLIHYMIVQSFYYLIYFINFLYQNVFAKWYLGLTWQQCGFKSWQKVGTIPIADSSAVMQICVKWFWKNQGCAVVTEHTLFLVFQYTRLENTVGRHFLVSFLQNITWINSWNRCFCRINCTPERWRLNQ